MMQVYGSLNILIFGLLCRLIVSQEAPPLVQGYCREMEKKVYYFGGKTSDKDRKLQTNSDVYTLGLDTDFELKSNKAPWKKVNDNPTSDLSFKGASVLASKDHLILVGGEVGPLYDLMSDFNVMDYSLSQVNQNSNILPNIVQEVKTVVDGTLLQDGLKAYLYGGTILTKDSNKVVIEKLYVYDLVTRSWNETNLNLPSRHGHASILIKDIIYSIGGITDGIPISFDNLTIIDTKESTYKTINLTGDIPASAAYYTINGNQSIYLIVTDNSFKIENEIYELNLSTLTWKKHVINGFQQRPMSCNIIFNNYLIQSFGGGMNNGMDETQLIDLESWTKVNNFSTKQRQHVTTPTPKDKEKEQEQSKAEPLNLPALIGGIVGGLIFLIIVIVAVFIFVRRRNKTINKEEDKARLIADITRPLPTQRPLKNNLDAPYFNTNRRR